MPTAFKVLVLLLAAGITSTSLFGCNRPAGDAQPASGNGSSTQHAPLDVRMIETPAGTGSLEPQVTSSTRGALVSWVEQQGPHATLKFAEWTTSGWTPTKAVASGDNWFVSHADVPTVARLRDGTLVANWLVSTDPLLEAYDLMLSYSTDDGVTWARPFSPHHDKTTTQHGFASFFELPESFGLVWLDGREQELDKTAPEGGAMTLRAATFDRTWKQSSEAAIDVRVCECCSTTVAVTAEGAIAAFRDRSADEIRDIAVSRLEGTAWSPSQTVHADGWKRYGCPVNGPALSAQNRHVAAAWYTMTGEQGHAFAAFSSDAGRQWGPPIRLDEDSALGYVDVELLDDGAALATWVEAKVQQAPEIRLRRIEPDGMRGTFVTIAGASGGRPVGSPRMTRAGDQLVLAWTESTPPVGGATEGSQQVKTAVARIPRATAVK